MRNLIVSSAFAALLAAGSAALPANAATWNKGSAPAATAETITQTQEIRCYRNAPVDGCGRGFYRTKRGGCRPC